MNEAKSRVLKDSVSGPVLAQRYAEVRKGMGLKIVGYAADSILQVLVPKINREAVPGRNAKS